jgi:hypothetical protein
MPTVLNTANTQSNISANIYTNGSNLVTAAMVASVLQNMSVSYINRITDLPLLGLKAFSATTPYLVGDCCVYTGNVYQCTTAHTGAWNAGDFTIIGGGGTGTVTSVSGVAANGFTWSIANANTTPAITLTLQNATTSQSGQLTSTDWNTFNGKQAAITLTTTGTSGAATFISNVLNIPNYSSALTGYVPYTGATTNVNLGIYGLTTNLLTFSTLNNFTPAQFLAVNSSNNVGYRTFAQTLSDIGGVPTTRTLTINGTTYDLSANRSWSVGTGTPAGSDTQLQYNSSSAFGASPNLTFDYTNNILQIGGTTTYSKFNQIISSAGALVSNSGLSFKFGGSVNSGYRYQIWGVNLNTSTGTDNTLMYTGETNATGSHRFAFTIGGGTGVPTQRAWGIDYNWISGGNIFYFTGLATFIGGAVYPTEQLEVSGNAKFNHLVGRTSAPTIAAGTGAGTSPTVSLSRATDLAGVINVTTGTLPTLSATVATITFNTAYGAAPKVILTSANANSAALNGVNMVYIDDANTTTGVFVITAGTTALTASTAYKWYYQVMQ